MIKGRPRIRLQGNPKLKECFINLEKYVFSWRPDEFSSEDCYAQLQDGSYWRGVYQEPVNTGKRKCVDYLIFPKQISKVEYMLERAKYDKRVFDILSQKSLLH